MGFLEVLTIIFIVLKLIGTIDWSWWIVISPMYLAVTLYIIVIIPQITIWRKEKKNFNKRWRDF